MYREDEFYYLTDRLHFDIYNMALSKYLITNDRLVIKIFKKDKDIVIIETLNGNNTIIKDTRSSNYDIYEMDLVFVKMLERYTSDYEIKGMVYEYIDGIGSWYRVKIDGFNPKDKDLNIFYNKKKVTIELIKNSDVSDKIKQKQLKFLKITKGLKFTRPSKIKQKLNIYD